MAGQPVDVFISYAHTDEAFKEELEEHLAGLKRDGTIRVWQDRDITAGEDWRGQIDEKLESADLILLLVSASFMASDYCFDVEATRALERHNLGEARVVPIVVRSCDWQTETLAELQALPADARPVQSWPDRDEAWADVVRGLRRAIDPLRGEQAASKTSRVPPGGKNEPRYRDAESRRLSLELKKLFRRRKDLTTPS